MIIEPGNYKKEDKECCCDCSCEIGDHIKYWGWSFCIGCWAEYTNDYSHETDFYFNVDKLRKGISEGKFIGKEEELKKEVDALEELERMAMIELHNGKKYENHISVISNRKDGVRKWIGKSIDITVSN